jgi:hypothetical protein
MIEPPRENTLSRESVWRRLSPSALATEPQNPHARQLLEELGESLDSSAAAARDGAQ